jgi:putative ABC transport system permease protein
MRARDALAYSFENLAAHKLRSALTMLGMMFGVGAVIAMLSIGAGAEQEALQMIERLGLRNLVVRAKSLEGAELTEARTKSMGLSMRDIDAIREAVPEVQHVAARVAIEPWIVLAAGNKTDARLLGVSEDWAEVVAVTLAEGRFLDSRDRLEHAQVAVLGASARRDLFGVDPVLGRSVKVNDVWLEVIGVLSAESEGGSSFQGVSLGSTAREIYVPVSTALRKFERNPQDSPLEEVVVHLQDQRTARRTAAVLATLLDRLHNGVSDYELVVPESLLRQSQKTQRLFNLVMGCIAGISLVVGGIGIMNIMLASVLEQTREIGVRRAVGARRRDIRFQFLAAAFTISLLGGTLGVVLGVAIAQFVALWAGWPTVVTLWSIGLATGVSAAVGVASGFYPAQHAASLDPVEALRYE